MSEHDANLANRAIISWLRKTISTGLPFKSKMKLCWERRATAAFPVRNNWQPTSQSHSEKRSERVSGEFVAREDYTWEEKIEIAIGAVDAVIVGATKIEKMLSKSIKRRGNRPDDHIRIGRTNSVIRAYRSDCPTRTSRRTFRLTRRTPKGGSRINADLLSKIASVLAHTVAPNLTSSSEGDDLYEAYIWSIVIEAAKNKGANVAFRDVSGNQVTTDFFFRSSPGELWWHSHPYCHAEIHFDGCPTLEAHTGIYVSGRSNVRHECDVAILHKSESDVCRNNHVLPRSSKVVLAIECKYYVNSKPGLALGRGFLGLREEIQRDNRFFIAISHSKSVEKLLAKHTRDFDLMFTPVIPHNVSVMRSVFESVFAKFKAQHN